MFAECLCESCNSNAAAAAGNSCKTSFSRHHERDQLGYTITGPDAGRGLQDGIKTSLAVFWLQCLPDKRDKHHEALLQKHARTPKLHSSPSNSTEPFPDCFPRMFWHQNRRLVIAAAHILGSAGARCKPWTSCTTQTVSSTPLKRCPIYRRGPILRAATELLVSNWAGVTRMRLPP